MAEYDMVTEARRFNDRQSAKGAIIGTTGTKAAMQNIQVENARIGQQFAYEYLKMLKAQNNFEYDKNTGRWVATTSPGADAFSSAISSIQSYLPKVDELAQDAANEWGQYKEKFGGLQSDSIAAAREDIKSRAELISQFKGLTSNTNIESSADRAGADVASLADQARRTEARRLVGLGVDPTSGVTRSAMTGIGNQEALTTALAKNTARTGEKQRLTGATLAGISAINPNTTAGIAQNIASGSNQLLNTKAAAVNLGTQARSQMSNIYARQAEAQSQMIDPSRVAKMLGF